MVQLHMGGGTPTFHDDSQLGEIITQLGRNFKLSESDDREFSIEVDPRTVDEERLIKLAEMGFNRLSIGIQDFDPVVQKAINRVQDKTHSLNLIEQGRKLGFKSISADLIYGLPFQSPQSFELTLDSLIEARPDRVAIYAYAHLPEMFRAQRMFKSEDLPDADTRLQMLKMSVEKMVSKGYVYIGMDHFSLPDDELARAQRNGDLQRSFPGYSTHKDCDLIGLGASAIGKVGHCYSQNHKDIKQWQLSIESGTLPVWRGITLQREDLIRATIIDSIMCHNKVIWSEIDERFNIECQEYFAREMLSLNYLSQDGLVLLSTECMDVTALGQFLVRSIAMVFDQYLPKETRHLGYTQVI